MSQTPTLPSSLATSGSPNRPWQFSLDTLLLLTTLIAVLLGVTLVLPVIGSVLTLVSIAALFRARAACRLQRTGEVRVPCRAKLANFFRSLVLILIALYLGFAVLWITFMLGAIIVGSVVPILGYNGSSSAAREIFSIVSLIVLFCSSAAVGVYLFATILKTTWPHHDLRATRAGGSIAGYSNRH